MSIQTILIILFTINVLALMLNFLFWFFVTRGDSQVRKKQQEINHKLAQVLEEAHQQSKALLTQATNKSQQLIADTQVMVDDIQTQMREKLAQARDANLQQISHHLQAMDQENTQFFTKLRKDLQETAAQSLNKSIQNFNQELLSIINEMKSQTLNMHTSVEERINQHYQDAIKQIDQYRQEQQANIDQAIQELIKKVALQVLPEVISIEQHSKLIMESLEKAKQKGVWDKIQITKSK